MFKVTLVLHDYQDISKANDIPLSGGSLSLALRVLLDLSTRKRTREDVYSRHKALEGEQCRSDAGANEAMAEYLWMSQRLYIHSFSSQNCR